MTIPPPAEIRRIAYLGTPELAVPPLTALVEAGYEIPLVVSRADTRRGRGGGHQPSPVKAAAESLGLPVTDQLADLANVDVDLGVVVAYGRIIPASVLDDLAMVNIHFSLLPRWRGAAPVERAILAGDAETGVCLMAVEEGLDTGAVYGRGTLTIGDDESLDELRDRLVEIGVAQLLSALAEGLGEPADQFGEPVYADKLSADDRRIDWTAPAIDVHRRVRVGGAWTTFRDKRIKVHCTALSDGSGAPGSIDGVSVNAGSGAVELVEIQPEGKPRQEPSAWRNGAQPGPDDRFV
ncbi:MAG: methionyl-tRNA formyltransferase [Acidimicrobiales bacterium]|nr:methionyl-tRNA formyltransferase [Acidimicrobiales bacterium]